MEELGIGRPSTYASILDRAARPRLCAHGEEPLHPRGQGPAGHRLPGEFFRRYVEYDFTADLEEKLDQVSAGELDWKACCASSGGTSPPRSARPRSCASPQVLDALNELLGPHIFPPSADGTDPRVCPTCGTGRLSLKTGKFGAFIGCSNYPECRYTRQLAAPARATARAGGAGDRELGDDPETGLAVSLQRGRFGPYVQLGEPTARSRSAPACPRAGRRPTWTWRRRCGCCACRARSALHPEDGQPILAGIGRYGPYVQHGETYANLGRADEVFEVGVNRAVDLIVAKESAPAAAGAAARATPARPLGADPANGQRDRRQVRALRPVRERRHGERHAAEGAAPEAVTLDEAAALLAAKRAAGPSKCSVRRRRRGARGRAKARGRRRAGRLARRWRGGRKAGSVVGGGVANGIPCRGNPARERARIMPLPADGFRESVIPVAAKRRADPKGRAEGVETHERKRFRVERTARHPSDSACAPWVPGSCASARPRNDRGVGVSNHPETASRRSR